jgi:phosphate-selective porin
MLEDASLAWAPSSSGRFRVIVGQFKAPLGRQELNSSGNQQFVDRSVVSNEYSRGRDTGLAVQGVLGHNALEYRVAMFNGNGLTRTDNDNDTFQYNARLMWQPNGSQALVQRAWVSGALYSEADFESTTTPIYAVALSVEHNDFHRTTAGNDVKSNVVGVDGIFKFKGLSATAEYYLRRREPETGASFDSNGGFLQAGVMLNRTRTWEVAFRYGRRDVSDLVDDDDIGEIRGGVSYYYRRHALKFQADFGQVEDRRGPTMDTRKDRELRAQLQFVF